MEENRESRNSSTHIWPFDFSQSCQSHSIGKRKSLQQLKLEYIDILMDLDIKTYLRPNLPKMDNSSKWKSSNCTISRRNRGKYSVTLRYG